MRSVVHGKVAFAWPVDVVDWTSGRVVAGLSAGTIGMVPDGYPDDPASLERQSLDGAFRLVERAWAHTNCLHVFEPGLWWGTRLMWSADTGEFLCWYVDFIRPATWRDGFIDHRDLALDIVVSPDGNWVWKDEEQYARKIDIGLIDADEHRAVQAARDEAVEAISSCRYPFDGSHLDWKPSPGTQRLPSNATVS